MKEPHLFRRVVTHTDFDGVISALLIRELFDIERVEFTEPWMIQKREFDVRRGDVILDLPYGEGCASWFDHHKTSASNADKGVFDEEAKSCARVIYNHYHKEHPEIEKFKALVDSADKIDSASFSKEDLEEPDACGRLSIAIKGDEKRKDDEFRLFLLNMLAFQSPEQVINQPIIKKRVEEKMRQLEDWKSRIDEYVTLKRKVILVDRTDAPQDLPHGQSFWLYLLYPGHAIHLTLNNIKYEPKLIRIGVGENIFEKINTVDLGDLMKKYGGGGHKAAAGCSIERSEKERVVKEIITAIDDCD